MRHRPAATILLVQLMTLVGVAAQRGVDGKSPAAGETLATRVELLAVGLGTNPDGSVHFACQGAQWISQSGEPDLPWRVVTVLLPPDAVLRSVAVHLEDARYEELPIQGAVNPVGPQATAQPDGPPVLHWPAGRVIQDGRDQGIYGVDVLWPTEDVRLLSTGRMRKWRLAHVAVPLVKYNPRRGTLVRLADEPTLVVEVERDAATGPSAAELADGINEKLVRALVIDYPQQRAAYQAAGRTRVAPGYAIITTSAIQNASTMLNPSDPNSFVAHKASLGFNVEVVTEEDWGGGTGNEAAVNIRTWLQDHYVTHALEYALLIGYPGRYETDPNNAAPSLYLICDDFYCPYKEASDSFYTDLTGNWDYDEDGSYGEDEDEPGMERDWEVAVGRIPFYGSPADPNAIAELDTILQRTIAYEDATETAWRKNVLLPMVPFDEITPNYQLGEEIKDDLLAPSGWSWHRVYQESYNLDPPPETFPGNIANTTAAWSDPNSPRGLVVWQTHGETCCAGMVMDCDHAGTLSPAYPAFTCQISCSTAWPETPNLAYVLLKGGAICTIAAAAGGRYQPGQTHYAGSSTMGGIAHSYTSRLMTGMPAGQAFQCAKQVLHLDWQDFKVFCLYGDPSLRLVTPTSTPVHNITQDTRHATIQEGLDLAADGDEIVLDVGTYTGPCNHDVLFENRAVMLRSSDPNDPDIVAQTVIDCQGSVAHPHRAFIFRDGEDASSILAGLTITNAYADCGGAIYCLGTPTIRDCVIEGNVATAKGGAAYIGPLSQDGTNFLRCSFVNNSAPNGGALASEGPGLVQACYFTGNAATYAGGAIYTNSTSFAVEGSFFRGNMAGYHGGAVYGPPALTNCVLSGNVAGIGGACYGAGDQCTLTNCTLTGNEASAGPGGGASANPVTTLLVRNCIFWANTGSGLVEEAQVSATALDIGYTCIQGWRGCLAGVGNFGTDPLFVDADGPDDVYGTQDDDLHLQTGSPGIDAGDNDSVPTGVTTDADGHARILDCRVDLGAYESPAFPDCNNNNTGDVCDVAAETSPDCNHNGIPDECDLAAGTSVDLDEDGIPDECSATTLYVDAYAASRGHGLSWDTAFTDLQSALELASRLPAITEIRVACGTYLPTDPNGPREATFRLHSGLAVRGAYAGSQDVDPNWRNPAYYETILSGAIGDPNDPSDNSYHVVTAVDVDDTAVLDGFTVTRGDATDDDCSANSGAGLLILGPSPGPTVRACTFTYNSAAGGGAVSILSSSPIFQGCTFQWNSATGDGEGGGALLCSQGDPLIKNCLFKNNSATGDPGLGGAIRADGGSLSLLRCTFTRNTAPEDGGGAIAAHDTNVNGLSCDFLGNVAGYYGGGAAYHSGGASTYSNCAFSGNHVVSACGGGLYLEPYTDLVLANCTFAGNLADGDYHALLCDTNTTAAVYNCILWDGTTECNLVSGDFSYSDVYDEIQGNGNVSADPCFVRAPSAGSDGVWGTADDDYGSLRLRLTSPCIDAGDNTLVPADRFDLDGDQDPNEPLPFDRTGHARFIDVDTVTDTGNGTAPIVDMGAYEASHLGDMNCDGAFTNRDVNPYVLALSNPASYAATYPNCNILYGDMNGDGSVDLEDINCFISCLTDSNCDCP